MPSPPGRAAKLRQSTAREWLKRERAGQRDARSRPPETAGPAPACPPPGGAGGTSLAGAPGSCHAGGGAPLTGPGNPTFGKRRLGQSVALPWGSARGSLKGQAGVAEPSTLPSAKCLRQLHLDLGQADFSLTRCHACGMHYAKGELKDEKIHAEYHRRTLRGVSFKGHKDGRVVFRDAEGYIVMVLPRDPLKQRRTIHELCQRIEAELGFSHGWLQAVDTKAFLYVSKAHVVRGVVLVQAIRQAVRCCPARAGAEPAGAETGIVRARGGAEPAGHGRGGAGPGAPGAGGGGRPGGGPLGPPVPAVCGVRALWVDAHHRRKGTATKLVDVARSKCVQGYVVPRAEVAFCSPTHQGHTFAERFTRVPNFLIY
eukprot:jgi/Tetstr1/420954/TSEL_012014.t1